MRLVICARCVIAWYLCRRQRKKKQCARYVESEYVGIDEEYEVLLEVHQICIGQLL